MTTKWIDITSRTIRPDQPDSNGRIWPRVELERSINEFNTRVPVVCELDDPPSLHIDLNRVSHQVIGMSIKNDQLQDCIGVLTTPQGQH